MGFKEKVGRLPKAAGVYFLKDSSGRVLYIGKAKSLRNRVGAYLRTDQESPKIASMIFQTESVVSSGTLDYLKTTSQGWRIELDACPSTASCSLSSPRSMVGRRQLWIVFPTFRSCRS